MKYGEIQENKLYLIGVTVFLAVGILIRLFVDHGDAVFFFGENRTDFTNQAFPFITKIGEELSYLICFLALLFVRYRYAIMIGLTAGLVTLVAFTLKAIFSTPRPSTFLRDIGQAEEFNFVPGFTPGSSELLTGLTSFPSGHTMSAFALFGFMSFLYESKAYDFLFFILAVAVGISRIYLGQHFLVDILGGAFCGTVLAWLIFRFQQSWSDDPSKWYNGRIGGKTPLA